ncbi:MAG: carbohydrate binding family 9 domain-containing protein, partial [Gemmatimonadota bacterium]|nr:carbohydrate binding family 9 domain-containing protein [Gemmatimonadota bacterium]
MSIHNRPGPNAREKGLGLTLGVALVMGQALLLIPGQVAGQAQGRGEPTSVIDTVVDNTGLVPDRPTVRPTRTDTPPEIDGRLDDEVWKTAAVLTEFVQASPLDGAPATEATEVYVAYDAENLYFGFYAHYEDPSIMRANRVDRDRAMMDDLMTVYFDTFMDQQNGYDFDVNAYGVPGDGIIRGGPSGGGGRCGRGGGGGSFGGGSGRIPFADRS